MFEDSTFESTGRIKTRSRRWMVAAFTLNGSILVAMVLVPLIYPNALPSHFIPPLLVAPAAPVPETPPPAAATHATVRRDFSSVDLGRITAPPRIPTTIDDSPAPSISTTGGDLSARTSGADGSNPFGREPVVVVRPPAPSTLRVSSKLEEGNLIYRVVPQYPVIAKTVGQQGTVILQATISKSGTIEHLQVVSGPEMLRQAAIDAVKTWRYRPYLLNDQPIEVETTVSVIFRIDR